MKKQRVKKFTSTSLRWLGVALMLTALFVWVANPVEVILFLAPYTGSRTALAKGLVVFGAQSAILGFAIRRGTEKC